MCGIAGYYSFNTKISSDILKKMNASTTHRGPDAKGFYATDSVGLTHNRLSIIDLSEAANQPMHSACKRFTIVFNGEIYNFNELIKEYALTVKTTSDTEVAVELFAKFGYASISKLKGMFAAAIYDNQTNELFLFRDRTGIKPLFYYLDENALYFASELKALYQIDYIKQHLQINQTAIQLFLHLGYIPQPHTIYTNIFKFPTASFAKINATGMDIKPYWDAESHINETTFTNEEETKQELKSRIKSSVKSHMICDVPFGTFLSGGIDSSLISAIAAKQTEKQLQTFSIGFEESKYNESSYAKKVASHIQSNHHEFILSLNEVKKHIPTLFDIYDEPFSDSSAIPTMLVSKMAKQHVKMVLSGDGGDELFMGYGAYKWAKRLSNPLYKCLISLASTPLQVYDDNYKRIAKLVHTTSSSLIQSHIFSQEQGLFSEKELSKILLQSCKPIQDILPFKIPINRTLNTSELQALFDLTYYLKDDLLVKVDRASMYNSLEVRVPFLDSSIVEYALNIDSSLKIKNNTEKYILKQVLFDFIPKEFFNRPKWGFSIPLQEWLSSDLSYLIDDYLSNKLIIEAGFVNPDMTKKLIKDFKNGQVHLYNRIWNLIILHRWYINHKTMLHEN